MVGKKTERGNKGCELHWATSKNRNYVINFIREMDDIVTIAG